MHRNTTASPSGGSVSTSSAHNLRYSWRCRSHWPLLVCQVLLQTEKTISAREPIAGVISSTARFLLQETLLAADQAFNACLPCLYRRSFLGGRSDMASDLNHRCTPTFFDLDRTDLPYALLLHHQKVLLLEYDDQAGKTKGRRGARALASQRQL